MRVQLAQQAQEILGTSDLVIITERVDDVALLIGQMVKTGGVGHMTVDTCGKPYLPTLHTAFKAHRMSAEVPRSSKESCCPNMAIRLGEFLAGHR